MWTGPFCDTSVVFFGDVRHAGPMPSEEMRGLPSIADDYANLVAADRVPADALRLIRPDQRVRLPDRSELWPHPAQLRCHREAVFGGCE